MSPPTLTIRKGTLVFSTAPGWPPEGRPAKREQKVAINHYDHTRVVWAGAGGYWKWVKL